MAPKAVPKALLQRQALEKAKAKATNSPRQASASPKNAKQGTASPKGGKGGKAPSSTPSEPVEALPRYAEYFDGTWVKEGSDVTYDVQGAKKIVIFDDNKDNKKYRFEATDEDACMMTINDKKHTGKMLGTNQIKWSTGSIWMRPGFDGSWVKENKDGTVATFDVQPGKNVVIFDDDKKYEFDVRSKDTCIMIINGKEHQGRLVNPHTLTWSNGSSWTKPSFGGRWQKDGSDQTFFVQPGKDLVTFDDGKKYEFDVVNKSQCKMTINGKEHSGELLQGNTIRWANGSVWVKLDVDSFGIRGPSPEQVRKMQEQIARLDHTSPYFYRDMVGTRAEIEPTSFSSRYDQVAPRPANYPPASPLASGLPGSAGQQRSVFGCPCCGRLFHVYIEGGQYHAVVAKGLETVRAQLRPGFS